MATTRKRPPAAPAPESEPAPVVVNCEGCAGTGQVTRPMFAGRTRHKVALQEAVCLDCLGTGSYLAPF
jgi:DnaJ-class molecular chaperone